MANRLCRYTSNYVVKAMDCSSTLSILVDRAGDTGQDVWVYQKYYNTTEGFVVNLSESTYSEWLSELSEIIDRISRTDLKILKSGVDSHETYKNNNGLGVYNCVPIEAFNSFGTSFSFKDKSSASIPKWIPNTERIYFNGLRSTAYTANSSGGKIVFLVAPSSTNTCIADFQLYSTKSYSDTGWLPTT
jgi:hypothetical protein